MIVFLRLFKNFFFCFLLCFLAFASLNNVYAETLPDAGRIIQENNLQKIKPPSNSNFKLEDLRQDYLKDTSKKSLTLNSVTFEGNQSLTAEELGLVIGELNGKSFDFYELVNLTNSVTNYYREKGYSFARAYLPPQSINNGNLLIKIEEGFYGDINTIGDDKFAPKAKDFLSRLNSGDPIYAPTLESSLLILEDQPGIKITPLMRPGQAIGTGDLDVRVDSYKRYGGSLYADNYGNRYSGRTRGRFSAFVNSPFMLGDQFVINGLYTNEDMWFGAANYNLPLNNKGLRGKVGFSHTYYELGKEYSSLEANGTADIFTIGIKYPIIRSQKGNINVDIDYKNKSLIDKQDAAGTKDKKSSDSIPITLSFDLRDTIGYGGVTYGALTWTHGNIDLGNGSDKDNDVNSSIHGSFNKLNLDAARIQFITPKIQGYFRLSSQWAFNNLDSSESFGLGGVNGVRAYPTGEGFGDQGSLIQTEIRYLTQLNNGLNLNPYIHYDLGTIKINYDNWTGEKNTRTISGAGIGLKTSYNKFTADINLAWRLAGGAPVSDSKDHIPNLWLSLGYDI